MSRKKYSCLKFHDFKEIIITFALQFKEIRKIQYTMAITTLKRKLKRKRQSQNERVLKIKQLSAKPVIKNVDVEEIKKEFSKKK
ncbi:MAG: hypothetical protein WD431_02605 [Cyclobacteriaceae bacterium]